MAVTKSTTREVTGALADLLAGIAGLRVYAYVADTFRPPGVSIGLPRIDYKEPSSGFCRALWEYNLTVIVARNNDREAQFALGDWVDIVTDALDDADPPGLFSVEAVSAEPLPNGVSVNGQDLPAYNVRANVRA